MANNINCLVCKHLRIMSGGCDAFPLGIPYEITSGEVEHDKKMFDQKNDIVFEEGTSSESFD